MGTVTLTSICSTRELVLQSWDLTAAHIRAAGALLLSNYVGAVVLAVRLQGAFNQRLMIGAHAVLGTLLLRALRAVHKAGYTREGVAAFYRAIWNLFYSEYFLLPFL